RVLELIMPTIDESDGEDWIQALINHDPNFAKKPESQKFTFANLQKVMIELRTGLFPHFELDRENASDIDQRINMVLYMTVRLALAYLGIIPYDDRNANYL